MQRVWSIIYYFKIIIYKQILITEVAGQLNLDPFANSTQCDLFNVFIKAGYLPSRGIKDPSRG